MAIPFLGPQQISIRKTGYTLPLTAQLGLAWQSYATQWQGNCLADSWASNQNSLAPSFTTSIYRLRPNSLGTYTVTGSSGVQPIGGLYLTDGMACLQPGPGYAPEFCPWTLSAANVGAQNLLVTGGAPAWGNAYQNINAWPIMWGGAPAFILHTRDNAFANWYAIYQAGTWHGWNSGFPLTGTSFMDVPNNRTLNLSQAGTTEVIAASYDSITQAETRTVLYNVANTAYSWLNSPSYSSAAPMGPQCYWALSADNSVGGSGPLVAGASPVFYLYPDLSGFVEVLFVSQAGLPAPLVPALNTSGVYGPDWAYGSWFFSAPLVVFDVDQNLYYIQLNAGGTAYDVYTSAPYSAPPIVTLGPIPLSFNFPFQPMPFCVGRPDCYLL